MMFSHKLLFVLIALSLTAPSGCAVLERDLTPSQSASQLRQTGEQLYASDNLAESMKHLLMAEKKDAADPEIQFALGLVYEKRGLPSDALSHYRKAISLRPDYSEAHNVLGVYFARQGQTDLAIEYLNRAISNSSYSTPQVALYNLGETYEQRGDPESALQKYREAVKMRAEYGPAYFRSGMVLEGLHRGDEARQAYKKAVEYSPGLAEAHFRYGMMSYAAGELEGALYSLNCVTKLAPDAPFCDEARHCLSKMKSLLPGESKGRSGSRASDPAVTMDVLSAKDMGFQPLPTPTRTPEFEFISSHVFVSGDVESHTAKSTQGVPAKVQPAASGAWVYVVQVGSFLARENAQKFQSKLNSDGFSTVMRACDHQILGNVFVVQLKPIGDEQKLEMLLSRLERERQVTPVVIKLPAS